MVQLEIHEAAKRGARLIEVRLDFLRKAPDFKRLLENKPCPLVATVRRPADGGKWDGTEEARLTLLRQAIVAGFDWVDLETDVSDSIRRFGKVRRIVSYHNFREAPYDLDKIHRRMCNQDADVVKVVVRAQNASDNLRVLDLLKKPAKPTVAFCMGDLGIPSRFLSLRAGAPFTYAAFNPERSLAPGLPSFAEARQIFFGHLIDSQTRVFGVIGDPVGHSLSPLLHNAALRRLGMNALYLPFRVPRGDLGPFLKAFERVPVQGYSVTLPHKESAAELADRRDPTVERTGAANTLVYKEGLFHAFNTDYQGSLDALNDLLPSFSALPPELPTGVAVGALPPALPTAGANTLHSKVALVLGSGGVARAIAHALHREGALVTISSRTLEHAQTLAVEVGCRNVEWKARHGVICEIVVNCTPVGMHPFVDESPLHPSFLKPGLIVFDTVYTPEQTLLVKEARERNCHIITGIELFVRQAGLQFRHFTGRDAPLELLRKVLRRALSPVSRQEEEEDAGAKTEERR
jgi:3-dehydroquinate dehydratase/shikimate dehydrogenase